MTLREYQLSCKESASFLGEYNLLTKTELANGYCDADEASKKAREEGNLEEVTQQELLRDSYYSALLLRYWYKIFEWRKNSASLNLDPVDFVGWLSHSLYVAFYYRVWRYEYKAEVKEGNFIAWKLDKDGNKIPNKYYYKVDPNASDKIINRCCGSMRGRVYQYMNKDKRKSDTQTFSIDKMVEEEGDLALASNGMYESSKANDGVYLLINALLSKGEKLEALIINGIANYDMEKVEKVQRENEPEFVSMYNYDTGEYEDVPNVEYRRTFDARRLVKHLNSLTEEDIEDFCLNYELNLNEGLEALNQIKKTSNPKLYKLIEKTRQEILNSKELSGCIS